MISVKSITRFLLAGLLFAMVPGSRADDHRVLAAGSLRLAVTEMLETCQSQHGAAFDSLFGPSGKLRQLIEEGESFSLFLSASKKHTDALLDQGKVKDSRIFTRNALCLMAAPGREVAPGEVVDALLATD